MREWQDLYGQLRQAAADLGLVTGRGRDGDERMRTAGSRSRPTWPRVHISLLSGLLSHVGMRDTDTKARGPGQARGR